MCIRNLQKYVLFLQMSIKSYHINRILLKYLLTPFLFSTIFIKLNVPLVQQLWRIALISTFLCARIILKANAKNILNICALTTMSFARPSNTTTIATVGLESLHQHF